MPTISTENSLNGRLTEMQSAQQAGNILLINLLIDPQERRLCELNLLYA